MVAGAGASNGNGVAEIDEDLHSRQLAVYGREAMRLLFASNVLVSGLNGLGAETGACPHSISDFQCLLLGLDHLLLQCWRCCIPFCCYQIFVTSNLESVITSLYPIYCAIRLCRRAELLD
jgi:hypothetical protein